MAKRRLTSRQKRRRIKKIRNRVVLVLAMLALASAAMAPDLRAYLTAKIRGGVQAFADLHTSEINLVLPKKKLALLQLGVFDNGESAQSERARLAGLGVPCLLWQDERMRLIADAAADQQTLMDAAAQGLACFTAEETLDRVDVSLSAGERDAQMAAQLLHLPDETLARLEEDEALESILDDVQARARQAVSAHPENALYTQLAQSLINWCALMEETPGNTRPYARATMALLCRELRRALANQ